MLTTLPNSPFTVTTPGTPVPVTVGTLNPRCQSILFQALNCTPPQSGAHKNTGNVYLLDRNKKRFATLSVPTANTTPSCSATIPNAPAALNATQFFIDADNSGDGVDVSILTP